MSKTAPVEIAVPILHHVNLKTTRLGEMMAWYALVVGMRPTYAFEGGAWLSNDAANHRLALLSTPLVRDGEDLRPATWDEALDRAASGFRRNLEARGPNALGIFSCSKSTNEVNFLAQKLARVAFGNHNIDSCNRT